MDLSSSDVPGVTVGLRRASLLPSYNENPNNRIPLETSLEVVDHFPRVSNERRVQLVHIRGANNPVSFACSSRENGQGSCSASNGCT